MRRQLSFVDLAVCVSLGIAGLVLLGTWTARAEANVTSLGQVSVAQVAEAIELAKSDPVAANRLNAYLAGVGEATGMLLSATDASGKPFVTCTKPVSMTDKLVVTAIKKEAPDPAAWSETAATPIIVNAIYTMAKCQ